MLLQLSQFSLCVPGHPAHPLVQAIPTPLFMSMGNVYKFLATPLLYCTLHPHSYSVTTYFYFFLKRFFNLFFREGKGERKGEKHQCVVASCIPPTGDLAHNPHMCPDWESNQ